jgi:tetratricopeptide (TPR) repeat protein
MKHFILSLSLGALLVSFSFTNAKAQGGKYGADSAACVQNISLYREFYKQKNYKEATPYWRWIFLNCPSSTEYMYLDGVTLVKVMMQEEKDKAKLASLIDTLMRVYDQRIEYFNKEGFVLGRKGVDMVKLLPDKPEEAFKTLSKAYKIEGIKLEGAAADAYFQSALEMLKKGLITKDEALDIYDKLSEVISTNIIAKPDEYKAANENLETRFEEIADCPALINMFGPKFKDNPKDVELLKKITKMLDKRDCVSDQLYLDAVVNLDKLEPSANSKSKIAKMYFVKNNLSEAAKFYSQAIEMETDNFAKAQYYYELSMVNLKSGQYSNARANAQKAISLRPNWGKPYLIIGDAYVSSAKDCGENDFQQKAVYWIGVDKYQQAKSVDSSVSGDANSKIATFSKHFPLKADAFFHGYSEGDTYNIGCWINESTKVRTN